MLELRSLGGGLMGIIVISVRKTLIAEILPYRVEIRVIVANAKMGSMATVIMPAMAAKIQTAKRQRS